MTRHPRRDWSWAWVFLCWFSAIGLSAPLQIRQVGSQLQPLWDDCESLDNLRHVLMKLPSGKIEKISRIRDIRQFLYRGSSGGVRVH